MKWTWFRTPVFVWGVLFCTAADARAATPAKPEILAGWFGVFPELAGYQRSFLAPVVAKGKKPTRYRQTAKYEWTGGAHKLLEVTLARDPLFKKKYATAVLKKDKKAKPIRLGKRAAWLWHLEKEAGNNPAKVRIRLVLPLAADKVVILEARGLGPWEDLAGLAKRLNQTAIAKALAAPPRTDFKRTRQAFLRLRKGIPYSEVVPWVGAADRDVGSGIHVLVYNLADGSRLYLGFPHFQSMVYARLLDKNGKMRDLIK
jgi:hypothetical protein